MNANSAHLYQTVPRSHWHLIEIIPIKNIWIKCQALFPEKNMKNIYVSSADIYIQQAYGWYYLCTINVLKFHTSKFLTKWHMQTVQTKFLLHMKEQSDQVYTVCHSTTICILRNNCIKKQNFYAKQVQNKVFESLGHLLYVYITYLPLVFGHLSSPYLF